MSAQEPTECGPPTVTVGKMDVTGGAARTDDRLAGWSAAQVVAVGKQRGFSSPPCSTTEPLTASRRLAWAALSMMPNEILTVAASNQVHIAVSALGKSKRKLHAHSSIVILA